MKCPICTYSELKPNDKVCPQCHSDLEIFEFLSDTTDAFRKKNNLILILSIFLLFSIFSGAYVLIRAKKAIEKRKSIIEMLKQENQVLSESITFHEADDSIEALENADSPINVNILSENQGNNSQSEEYVVATGDNLWRIAEKYYNDGSRYIKIANDNNISNPKEIVTGTVLIINK